MNDFFNIVSSDGKTLDINIYGYISKGARPWYMEEEEDTTTYDYTFINQLQSSKAENINLHINSGGGSVFAAAAIKNQLQEHSAYVTAYIEGIAASAAVGLSMGANKVVMHDSALLMIHNPITFGHGEAKDMERIAGTLTKIKDTILNIYVGKISKLTREELSNMMDAETYLTANEALEYGFVDEIISSNPNDILVTDGAVVVNGAPIYLNSFVENSNTVFYNKIDQNKLMHYLNGSATEGGKPMEFKDFVNSLKPDDKSIIEGHINTLTAGFTNKMQDMETKLNASTASLNSANDSLQAAQAKIAQLEQLSKDTNAGEADWLNSLPEEAKNAFNSMKAQAEQTEKALNAMKEEAARKDFNNELNAFDSLPIDEQHQNALFALAKADATSFESVKALLTVANTAMKENFSEQGQSNGSAVADKTTDQVEQLITQTMNEDKSDYATAAAKVFNENPELYSAYRAEMN